MLAAIGSAIGLGNVWRFPYITGVNGGGAFVIIYCACILIIAVPLLMAEIAIGRRGAESPVKTMKILSSQEGRSAFWHIIGWQAIIAPTIGLMYYCVVAGWTLDYAFATARGVFSGVDAQGSIELFGSLTNDPIRMLFWYTLFIVSFVFIIARGIKKGLEKAIKWLMPCLGALLVLLLVYSAVTADFSGAAVFLFKPDFFKVTPSVVLMAIGQAFFSVNVAAGALITYGAYMPKQVSIPRVAGVIAFVDTGAALMMGFIIFPLVLSYGLTAGEGPGLVFVTLPIAFGQMPAGMVFGALFFILMTVAALTSALGMLEPAVSWLEEHRGFKRATMAVLMGVLIWVFGIPALLSFNIWSDVLPLDHVTAFAGKTIFDLMDFLVANIIIPVGGLILALFAGWAISKESIADELGWSVNSGLFRSWRFLVRYLAPVAIMSIFIFNIVGGSAA